MIITITGAYRNCGDHLIRSRAHALLRAFVDTEIVDIDRQDLANLSHPAFEKAKHVFLTGGPAYQRDIYPKVYPLSLDNTYRPFIPLGLGYKDTLSSTEFRFSPASSLFVQEIHRRIKQSSVRDHLTLDVLQKAGVSNVTMTGCPAWYSLPHLDKEMKPSSTIAHIAISAPAKITSHFFDLIRLVRKTFRKAEITIAFHHGYFPRVSHKSIPFFLAHSRTKAWSLLSRCSVRSLSGSLTSMEDLYQHCDLHIGYRVHAHLLRLSIRKPSILICEDKRGVGQALTLGASPLLDSDPDFSHRVLALIDSAQSDCHESNTSVAVMRQNFNIMKQFLTNI
jgi:polysaccharide pyruvyl transferase WcaK-like protein